MRSISLGFLAILVGSLAVFAQDTREPRNEKNLPSPAGEKITLNVEGAECDTCVHMLTTVLQDCKLQIASKFEPNPDGPTQVVVSCPAGCDLSACASKVAECKTPHRHESPPRLCLVMFAKLDEMSAKEAVSACRKLKGVDGAACKADIPKGEIHVKLTGGQKVTPEQLIQAFRESGVQVQLTRNSPRNPL